MQIAIGITTSDDKVVVDSDRSEWTSGQLDMMTEKGRSRRFRIGSGRGSGNATLLLQVNKVEVAIRIDGEYIVVCVDEAVELGVRARW